MERKRKISNQNNPSHAKVAKQDDEKQCQNVLNPLFMNEILLKILNYLDIDNLKRSRLVCKLWRFEGGRILLNKSHIVLDSFAMVVHEEISKESDQLENFLNTRGTTAPFNSAIKHMNNPNSLKNMHLILERTNALVLNSSYNHAQGKKIVEVLEFFPNLKILHLKKYCGAPEDFSAETKKSLLTKFEPLQEIRLKAVEFDPYHLTNLLLTKTELAINEIQLEGNSPFFGKYLESGCNWPIKTLVMDMLSRRHRLLSTVQPFLDKISGSLKHLEWKLADPETRPVEYFVPWANNFVNTSALNLLQTFFINCVGWTFRFGDFSWLIFTFALQLPNLKKLIVNKIPENFEEGIRKWNEHSTAAGRTLKSESLEELSFICSMQKVEAGSFIVFSRRLWPNLKSLHVDYPPHHLPSSFLLSEWIGLERLDLKFEKMSKSEANLWTSWFTGGQKSEDGTSIQHDANFAVKDLKDLKHFGLCEEWTPQPTRIATDFLVDNSLKFMTRLQSLYLENSNISQKVKKTLKEALGPNVYVEFKN